jgi:hypothetical protein
MSYGVNKPHNFIQIYFLIKKVLRIFVKTNQNGKSNKNRRRITTRN